MHHTAMRVTCWKCGGAHPHWECTSPRAQWLRDSRLTGDVTLPVLTVGERKTNVKRTGGTAAGTVTGRVVAPGEACPTCGHRKRKG